MKKTNIKVAVVEKILLLAFFFLQIQNFVNITNKSITNSFSDTTYNAVRNLHKIAVNYTTIKTFYKLEKFKKFYSFETN